MAFVSVLYISDDIVGPHLQLIRNVCDPISMAKPHITVRYFNRLKAERNNYKNTIISSIDLIEPGAFGLTDKESSKKQRTIFIKCNSFELKSLEHKPHYPYSELHITLYNGRSLAFAEKLLNTLKEMEWHFKVKLPDNVTLQEIEIKSRKAKQSPQRKYDVDLRKLFFEITSLKLKYNDLLNLSDEERLSITRKICLHLEEKTKNFDKIKIYSSQAALENPLSNEILQKTEIHLTPPELADGIVEYALSVVDEKLPIEFGDPAIGTGIFFLALMKKITANKLKSAIGVDISESHINELKKNCPLDQLTVIHDNFLHLEKLPLRTLVLANPPYLRHQEIDSLYKRSLKEHAFRCSQIEVDSKAGIYVYFILICHKWMEKGATAAWLVPSEFMQTNYGKALREYLCNQVRLLRIHNFNPSEPQFENAMVLPSVIVFQNLPPTDSQKIILSSKGSLKNANNVQFVTNSELKAKDKWIIPLKESNKKRRATILKIGDLFNVRRGIATGANSFFILTKEKAKILEIPSDALRPILPKFRTLKTDIIESDEDGYPKITPQLCLIDCNLPESEIQKNYQKFMNYLEQGKEEVQSHYLVQNRTPWYSQEKRTPAPFLCTYMGRQVKDVPPLKFIWNKSQAIAANTYLLLYPKGTLNSLLSESPQKMTEIFEILKETARLCMTDDLRTYAGGLRKIEPKELQNVYLASAPKWLSQTVDQMSLF